jgi:hypothetical protein
MKTYRAALVSIITAMTLIVSGCSGGDSAGGKVDEALLAKCDLLVANLVKLTYSPEFEKVDDPTSTFNYSSRDEYLTMNIGTKSRAKAKQLILDNHPYLADYLSKATGDEYSLDNSALLIMLEKAIEGTGFTLSLTAAQKQNTKGDYSDPSFKVLQSELIKLGLETDFNSDIPVGCTIIDDYKVSQADVDGVYYNPYMDGPQSKWADYKNSVEKAMKLVGITNTCEATGEFSYDPCGKKDYISTETYDPSPSARVNPWERDWRDEETEIMAKTVWCIAEGFNGYNKATDGCK